MTTESAGGTAGPETDPAPRPPGPPAFRLYGAHVVGPLAVAFCLWLLSTRTFAQAWVLAAIMLAGFLLWAGARRGGSAQAPLQ